ncbi:MULTISPECIES: DUF4145 domain-containing protein [unclassified Streptomyces]|uniref:DUF4145 domain-containing protein n=1 Tax=unclassified Streptomyces TaxID=2593676 RepID=UPI0007488681|nr:MULTISPECIES: DUF4145 domain-containing protein [unclassified Streptomyces]KUL73965.1 hypothetical protein ADL34_19080 [Streptomyces sp. NRRL WC-3605]KUL74376.1 hypothetical protein ADL33_17955 [Streptomyces sp. NRRL WC-3604]
MTSILNRDLRAISKGLSGDHLEDWPAIPCPTCTRGVLLPDPDSFVSEESATSRALVNHEAWEPEWIQGGFHGVLTCRKETCDRVRVIGEMSVDYSSRHGEQYEIYWTPTLFLPALPLLENRELCPPEVGVRVDAAAKILWLDPSAAANRIRAAVEALMDDRGVIRRQLNSKGKVVRLDLDRRIAIFKKALSQHADAADLLLAVKWIGNVGSHEDVLRVPDVLEGVEFLDRALSEIYGTSPDDVKKRAAEVTARRGRPQAFSVEVPF